MYHVSGRASATEQLGGLLEDLVRPTQLANLTLELGQPLCIAGRGADPGPAIDLSLLDPVPQRFRVDPKLAPIRASAPTFVAGSLSARLAALPAWVHQCNHHRPHTAIEKAASITRLDNLAGHRN
jgi:hypothetical protein